MNKYFEANGLKNGQKINMDEKLKSLLEVPENVQLTFLNLQHYLSKHYIKEEKPVTEKKPRAKKETPVKTERAIRHSRRTPSTSVLATFDDLLDDFRRSFDPDLQLVVHSLLLEPKSSSRARPP
jgi:hypothetical protein